MAKGNGIIVTANPEGKFTEGIIDGTPKPGTHMQIKGGVEPVNGRFTYEVYNQSGSGVKMPVLLLLEDNLQGKTASDAYVSGRRGLMYTPLPGEEVNVLKADVAGTGDDFTIGQKLMIQDNTGKIIAASSEERAPYQSLETVTDPTADQLVHVMATGV